MADLQSQPGAARRSFAADRRRARDEVKFTAKCPQFTDAGWDEILTGSYCEWNELFKALCDSNHDIRTEGEFFNLWEKIADAYCYVFAGRTDEFKQFRVYARTLFNRVKSSFSNDITVISHFVIFAQSRYYMCSMVPNG